jgi:hypothetical protein
MAITARGNLEHGITEHHQQQQSEIEKVNQLMSIPKIGHKRNSNQKNVDYDGTQEEEAAKITYKIFDETNSIIDSKQ